MNSFDALFDDAAGCGVLPLFATYDAGTIRCSISAIARCAPVHHISVADWWSLSAKGASEYGRRVCAALIHDAVVIRCRDRVATLPSYLYCRPPEQHTLSISAENIIRCFCHQQYTTYAYFITAVRIRTRYLQKMCVISFLQHPPFHFPCPKLFIAAVLSSNDPNRSH